MRAPSCTEFSHLSPLAELTSQAAAFPVLFALPWLPFIDLLHVNSFLKMKEDRKKRNVKAMTKSVFFYWI